MAAGIAEVPEASEHTSIKERVEHVAAQGRTEDLKAAREGSVAGSEAAAGLEESLWLCPIEDRRRLGSAREGMLEGFSLGSYLLVVDYTGRLFREGKAVISREVTEVFERLGSSAETWQARLERLRTGRLLGRFPLLLRRICDFGGSSTSRQAGSDSAMWRSPGAPGALHHVPNLGGCAAG